DFLLSGRSLSTEEAAQYVSENYFDPANLTWDVTGGTYKLSLSEDQWEKVNHLVMNMFYDDGEGYVDLGLDNVYEWDDDGSLIAVTDRTWLAINGQVVAYYYLDTEDDGENYIITGYVPCYVNDVRAQLLLTFDNERPNGYIAGVRYDYIDGETETVAKALENLQEGDAVDFVCDFYDYEGNYQDSYYLGEQWIVEDPENAVISNVDVGDGAVQVTYRFTDLYNQNYWTEVINLP
ncbi:MAG: peptidase C11, partial [Lachnospiraceae bacterium]|nr:peptidase C11 [Lachnospiraceae bacterium]